MANLLDLVFVVDAAGGLEEGLAYRIFLHEIAHEFAALDICQHFFHTRLGFVVRQNARARNIFAIFGGVRDRVVHVGNAAFVDQVYDQLHLVQALEIGHFGRIARLDQRFKAHADQLDQATAQHNLLAEQIGFAFFAEVGFDDARTPATDGRAIRQADFQRAAGGILVHSHQAGHAAAFGVFAAHGVAGALGRHHDHVNAGLRLDQAEMHVQAMGKCNGRTFAQVVMHVFFVGLGLQFIGHGEHDQVAPGGGLGNAHHLQAFAFGFFGRGRALAQGNNHILGARIAQVQRMGVALAAIAQNGHFFVFDQVNVAIAVIIYAHGGPRYWGLSCHGFSGFRADSGCVIRKKWSITDAIIRKMPKSIKIHAR